MPRDAPLHNEGIPSFDSPTFPISDMACNSLTFGTSLSQGTCFICADKPIPIWSIGSCHHPYCWKCSLRLRMLYENIHCPLCKTPLNQIVFTQSHDLSLPEDLTTLVKNPLSGNSFYFDKRLNIYFENDEMRQQVTQLLSLKCPIDPLCKALFTDRMEFLVHARKAHRRHVCETCFTHQKHFLPEIILFLNYSELDRHNQIGDSANKGAFRGHPKCGFCQVYYYSADELYEHCRTSHENCFVCQQLGKHHQYFKDYRRLEDHFFSDHFPCREKQCLEKKFVVFGNDVDLKAHYAEEHKLQGKQRSSQRQVLSINIDLQTGALQEQKPKKGSNKFVSDADTDILQERFKDNPASYPSLVTNMPEQFRPVKPVQDTSFPSLSDIKGALPINTKSESATSSVFSKLSYKNGLIRNVGISSFVEGTSGGKVKSSEDEFPMLLSKVPVASSSKLSVPLVPTDNLVLGQAISKKKGSKTVYRLA